MIKKFRFYSLFWKIFAIIWLSQALILLSASLIIGLNAERAQQNTTVERKIERQVQKVLHRYENSLQPHFPPWLKPFDELAEIIDLQNGFRIFGHLMHANDQSTRSFIVESENHFKYKVNYVSLTRGDALEQLWQRYGKVHVLFSLFFVSVFSAVITTLMANPIRRLKKHVTLLSDGELHTRVNEKLTRRQDEIGGLANSINLMAERINALIDDKQQLLADVSHELKAPIARMQVANEMASQIAEENNLPTRSHQQIDKDIQILTALINEILDLAKLDNATMNGQEDLVDLDNIILETIDAAHYDYPSREIRYTGLNKTFPVSQRLFYRIFNNLLNNSLKHTDSDIEISAIEIDNQIKVAVRDFGPGLQPEVLTNLFRPFTRGESKATGFGLGMTIAAKATEKLAGKIIASNHPEQGLIIEIYLPLKR
ncbi:sensor histidine kinase [Catenovulum maritimum]|uniref:histidine kinase n=1 Tax=Catenovulum maritimum TaxID=1513271 RepID=A0A0J8GZS0_9ALTE|nr:HAMP domain-containing sensor histidine kinase [Catenovulum maritimum]KMT66243.1 hypothetical protein XM47_04410 [Catenovulum maritimum]